MRSRSYKIKASYNICNRLKINAITFLAFPSFPSLPSFPCFPFLLKWYYSILWLLHIPVCRSEDSEQRQVSLVNGIAACDLQIAAPPGGDLQIPICRSEDRRPKRSRSEDLDQRSKQ